MIKCWKWPSQVVTLLIKLWAMLHILATTLFLLPDNPASVFYSSLVRAYMIPFFNQDWHLFSPRPPTSSLHYWIRCSTEHASLSQSPWVDPLARLNGLHKALRVVGHGRAKRFDEFVIAEVWAQALEEKAGSVNQENADREVDLLRLEHGELLASKALSSCRAAYSSSSISHLQIQIAQVFARNWSEVSQSFEREGERHSPKGVSIAFEPISISGGFHL